MSLMGWSSKLSLKFFTSKDSWVTVQKRLLVYLFISSHIYWILASFEALGRGNEQNGEDNSQHLCPHRPQSPVGKIGLKEITNKSLTTDCGKGGEEINKVKESLGRVQPGVKDRWYLKSRGRFIPDLFLRTSSGNYDF